MSTATIQIVPYRAQWPFEYAKLAALLREAMRDDLIALHHIGSTSVPGLDAKDIIDIQLTVAKLETCPIARIEAAGFRLGPHGSDHCPPGIALPEEELSKRYFRFQGRAANLHVREAGRFNQRYPLLCRDYLRAHKLAAAAYAEIKRQLAKYFPRDPEAYYAIKDPVFDLFMVGANEWATMTSWREPPSDG